MTQLRGKDCNFNFHWNEDGTVLPNLGEGVSRTSERGAVLWDVEVTFPSAKPMKSTVLARTKAQALKFTRNRYPAATTITCNGRHHDYKNRKGVRATTEPAN